MKPQSMVYFLDTEMYLEAEANQFLKRSCNITALEDYVFDHDGMIRLKRKLLQVLREVYLDNSKTLEDFRHISDKDAVDCLFSVNCNLRAKGIANDILRGVIRYRMGYAQTQISSAN